MSDLRPFGVFEIVGDSFRYTWRNKQTFAPFIIAFAVVCSVLYTTLAYLTFELDVYVQWLPVAPDSTWYIVDSVVIWFWAVMMVRVHRLLIIGERNVGVFSLMKTKQAAAFYAIIVTFLFFNIAMYWGTRALSPLLPTILEGDDEMVSGIVVLAAALFFLISYYLFLSSSMVLQIIAIDSEGSLATRLSKGFGLSKSHRWRILFTAIVLSISLFLMFIAFKAFSILVEQVADLIFTFWIWALAPVFFVMGLAEALVVLITATYMSLLYIRLTRYKAKHSEA